MNRFSRNHMLVGCLLLVSVSLQGCYGQFALTHKLYQWNGTLGDKWINSIMMVAMAIVPIYGIAILADGLVLNTMEFWTGKNPVTMGPEERETAGVVYVPEQHAWFVEFQGEKRKIADQDGEVLTLLYPDGRKESVTR